MDLQQCVYLGEEPPPLPVPEFEVSGAVPLDHLHSSQLLLSLREGSGDRKEKLNLHDVIEVCVCSTLTPTNTQYKTISQTS